MDVGLAQRDVPVHVINEYCRGDRSFNPKPSFDEDHLPRDILYFNYQKRMYVDFFPDTTRLGIDFALTRSKASSPMGAVGRWCGLQGGQLDLEAVKHLDEVRTEDISQSLLNLGYAPESGFRPSF